MLDDVYLAKLTTKHTVLKELKKHSKETKACLLYTSDAADE